MGPIHLWHPTLDSTFVSAQSIIDAEIEWTIRPIHHQKFDPLPGIESRHADYLYLTSRPHKCEPFAFRIDGKCAQRKWLNHNINFRTNFNPFPLRSQCPVVRCVSVVNVINCPHFVCRFFALILLSYSPYVPDVCRNVACVHLCRTGDSGIDNTKSSNQNTLIYTRRHTQACTRVG